MLRLFAQESQSQYQRLMQLNAAMGQHRANLALENSGQCASLPDTDPGGV
jgi:hypothetical protein